MPIADDMHMLGVLLLVLGIGVLPLALLGFILYRHRRTQRRLAESEDRFRLLFEHGGVGLALLSADGLIVQANPALEQLLGYEAGGLCGRRLSDLAHPQDRDGETSRIREQPPGAPGDHFE